MKVEDRRIGHLWISNVARRCKQRQIDSKETSTPQNLSIYETILKTEAGHGAQNLIACNNVLKMILLHLMFSTFTRCICST